jgi:hypothetical protein
MLAHTLISCVARSTRGTPSAKGFSGSRADEITELKVFGPPMTLAQPSAKERIRWSADRREYVAKANAICTRALLRLRRLKNPNHVAQAFADTLKAFDALRPPAGEDEKVASFLRPLRALALATRALSTASTTASSARGFAAGGQLRRGRTPPLPEEPTDAFPQYQ